MESFVVVVVAEKPERGARCLVFQARSMVEAKRHAVEKARAVEPLRWRVKSAERIPA